MYIKREEREEEVETRSNSNTLVMDAIYFRRIFIVPIVAGAIFYAATDITDIRAVARGGRTHEIEKKEIQIACWCMASSLFFCLP